MTAVVAANSTNALGVTSMGPSTAAAAVMPAIQIDFSGAQRTRPSTGSAPSAASILCDPGSSGPAPLPIDEEVWPRHWLVLRLIFRS